MNILNIKHYNNYTFFKIYRCNISYVFVPVLFVQATHKYTRRKGVNTFILYDKNFPVSVPIKDSI